MKYKILVTPSAFGQNFVKEKLNKYKKFSFTLKKGPINNKNKLKRLLNNFDGVIIGSEILDISTLKKIKKLKSIVRFGTSYENIDLNYCKKKNIKVYKLKKTINSNAVALHNLTLILCLTHNIKKQIIYSNLNKWERCINLDPKNIKIGIFGMGNTGKKLSKMLSKIGYETYYYSRKSRINLKNVKYVSSLKKLIEKSDILSINITSNLSTKNILNSKTLKLLKNKYIINTSRGDLIDEKTLFNLLKSNYILGAGLDVYSNEPSVGISAKIRKLKNVIGTPHNAFFDKNTITKMAISSINLMSKSFNGK